MSIAQTYNRAFRSRCMAAEPLEVYKSDARSHVARIEGAKNPLVLKRYTHSPLRQRLAWLLGMHPAQLELKRAAQMQRDGLPVVPVEDAWLEEGQAHVVTTWAGMTLLEELKTNQIPSHALRKARTQSMVSLLSKMLEKQWTFRDIKTSNIVTTSDGQLRLIDVGSARRSKNSYQRMRMLSVLNAALSRSNVARHERLRGLKLLLKEQPDLGRLRDIIRQINAVMLQ